jgi:hypothetical protein
MRLTRTTLARLVHENVGAIALMIVFGGLALLTFISVRALVTSGKALHSSQQAKAAADAGKDQAVTNGQLSEQVLVIQKALKDSPTQTAHAIDLLNVAAADRNADTLRKIGELFRAMGVPQTTIERVLQEPVPTPPAFNTTPAARAPTAPATTPATRTPAATPTAPAAPRSTPSPAIDWHVTVQCPVICPPQH